MATIPQTKKLFQVMVVPDAIRRIKTEAARTDREPGDVITDLATEHLPAVDATPAEESLSASDPAQAPGGRKPAA